MTRILVLTPYSYGTVAGPRSSFELWERLLREEGYEFDYAPFESERLKRLLYEPGATAAKAAEMMRCYVRRFADLRRLRSYDAVLVNREAALLGPEVFERLVSVARVPLIYHLDDPLYIPYRSRANGALSYAKCFGKVKRIARLAKVVIANSDAHREYLSRYARQIRQIPSVVDAREYRFEPRSATGDRHPVCVGWTGSFPTVPNLQVVADVLRRLGTRDDVRLRFVGTRDPGIDGVPYTAHDWRAETEVADLRTFDVGMVPLPDDAWSRTKFNLKLVQYMALGIPPVCTPLGMNPRMIEHGVTGFLASSPAEWEAALTRLVEDGGLRREMGARAAEEAHERYTLQANADVILETFAYACRGA